MNRRRPTWKEYAIMVLSLMVWFGVTALFVGLRPEHIFLGSLILVFLLVSDPTRRLVVAMIPFILFGISYDWMNLVPNYEINVVDIEGLYNSEKQLFGITLANGTVVTPNEFFGLHHCWWVDAAAGFFYLCWVPVPLLFGFCLYFAKQDRVYLHFAIVFLLVNLMGFAIYYIHPAAPPWYMAKYGSEFVAGTPGDVAGLGRFDQMIGCGVFDALYARNANVFAAVPSLHSSYMLLTFIYSLKAHCPQWVRIVFAIITLGIWFTAVYAGHHYLIDVLLGITTALVGYAVFEWGLMKISGIRHFVDVTYVNYIK